MPLMKNVSPPTEPPTEPQKAPSTKAESLIAAGGTATGSLLIWLISQVMSMESAVQKLSATQNVLIDDNGLIRASTTAIRAEIQLEELYGRLDRLERALVSRADD